MILIQHSGFFVITNSKGNYYTLSKSGKSDFASSLTNAYKWKRKDKAEKYLQICLNGQSDCSVKAVDIDNQKINKHLIDDADIKLQTKINYLDLEQWINSLSKITNGFTEIEKPLNQTINTKNKIEKTISDLRHYIEFGEFNAYQGFQLFRLFQNLLRQRRSCKDIIFMLENITENNNNINYIYYCAIQLKNRGYKPRILKTMFNDYV